MSQDTPAPQLPQPTPNGPTPPEQPAPDGAAQGEGTQQQDPPVAPDPAPDADLLEIRDGLWDWKFAAIAAGLLLVALLVLLARGADLLAVINLREAVQDVGQDPLNGTFGERFIASIAVLGLLIGACLLLVGSWMAAVELRARLRKESEPTVVNVVTGGNGDSGQIETLNLFGTPSFLGDTAKVTAESSKARGTALVLVGGLITIVASLAAGAAVAAASPEAPPATPAVETGTPES